MTLRDPHVFHLLQPLQALSLGGQLPQLPRRAEVGAAANSRGGDTVRNPWSFLLLVVMASNLRAMAST